MSAQHQPRLTPEQYLELERRAEFRSEYFDGRMYAMAGGSYAHARIIGNLTGELHAALKKGTCAVNSNDLRILVPLTGLYTYPDISVVCGEPRFVDGQKDTLLNPALIVEVLSPSTEGYDRGFKSAQYRTIEALQEYVLVSQTEARVEVFRREAGGWLLTEFSGMNALARFTSIDSTVSLAEIYAKVTLGSEEVSARPSN